MKRARTSDGAKDSLTNLNKKRRKRSNQAKSSRTRSNKSNSDIVLVQEYEGEDTLVVKFRGNAVKEEKKRIEELRLAFPKCTYLERLCPLDRDSYVIQFKHDVTTALHYLDVNKDRYDITWCKLAITATRVITEDDIYEYSLKEDLLGTNVMSWSPGARRMFCSESSEISGTYSSAKAHTVAMTLLNKYGAACRLHPELDPIIVCIHANAAAIPGLLLGFPALKRRWGPVPTILHQHSPLRNFGGVLHRDRAISFMAWLFTRRGVTCSLLQTLQQPLLF